ncbi:MAG: periplasmic heavy metal sensor [Proteobacteria bacterium]|nr:periplasmic heavy metal sensor [Pseudomonadota bacterium]NIS71749.1 periplasmic heavy metal sensor [Pseudomonadota bacterium]
MTEQLNLNDEEKGALDELFLDNRRKLIDLKGTMERERLELENVFEKESLDEPAVMAQFKRLEDARANLATERFRFVIEVRKMIGYDRFQSLKAFFTRLCRERERHGGERSKLKKYDHGGHARQWNE